MHFRVRPLRWPLVAVLLLFATGCAMLAAREIDRQYGTPSAKEFTPAASSAAVSYERDIQPGSTFLVTERSAPEQISLAEPLTAGVLDYSYDNR